MTDWKTQQMIKASDWPLAPELLAPGADFNARLAGGLVPLHWACQQGKAGLVKYMIEQGADVLDRAENGRSLLELAVDSESFQVVMLVIDRLKLLAAPPPARAFCSPAHRPARKTMANSMESREVWTNHEHSGIITMAL